MFKMSIISMIILIILIPAFADSVSAKQEYCVNCQTGAMGKGTEGHRPGMGSVIFQSSLRSTSLTISTEGITCEQFLDIMKTSLRAVGWVVSDRSESPDGRSWICVEGASTGGIGLSDAGFTASSNEPKITPQVKVAFPQPAGQPKGGKLIINLSFGSTEYQIEIPTEANESLDSIGRKITDELIRRGIHFYEMPGLYPGFPPVTDSILALDSYFIIEDSLAEPVSMVEYEMNDSGFYFTGVTSVASPSSQIPTLTEWGLIIFGVLLIGFMTWIVLKRRKTATPGV